MALTIVLMIPVILMLFSVMLDGILTRNIKDATQRYLDAGTLAIANIARTNSCIITDAASDAGIMLFNQNMSSANMAVEYSIVPNRSSDKDKAGIAPYVVTARVTNLIGEMFVPFDYDYRFTVESTAICHITW